MGNTCLGTSLEEGGCISYTVPVVLHLDFVQLRKIENNVQFILGKLKVKWCQFVHPTQMIPFKHRAWRNGWKKDIYIQFSKVVVLLVFLFVLSSYCTRRPGYL